MGDISIARHELIFEVPVTGTLTSWWALLSPTQQARFADASGHAYMAVDGFIVAPAADSIVRQDQYNGNTVAGDTHTIPPGASWQMPVENWLVNSSVKTASGGTATATLVVYVQ